MEKKKKNRMSKIAKGGRIREKMGVFPSIFYPAAFGDPAYPVVFMIQREFLRKDYPKKKQSPRRHYLEANLNDKNDITIRTMKTEQG